jgi:hypothetical protein
MEEPNIAFVALLTLIGGMFPFLVIWKINNTRARLILSKDEYREACFGG